MDTYYIDGAFVDEDKAMVSVKDITVLRGYGVFDFMITYNKRPFRLEEHVTRFENSAERIGLELHHSHGEICDIVLETIRKNPHHTESNIRIVYTGGISPDSVTPQGNGILMVMVTPRHEPPDWWYTDGAAIALVDMERFIPTAKSTAYLNAVYAQQQRFTWTGTIGFWRAPPPIFTASKAMNSSPRPTTSFPASPGGWFWNWRKRCWM
jgi:branched-chain amino acid aminotransferase